MVYVERSALTYHYHFCIRVLQNPTNLSDSYALWLSVMQNKYSVPTNTTFLHDYHGLLKSLITLTILN